MTYVAISIGAVLGANLRFLVGGWIAERWGPSSLVAASLVSVSLGAVLARAI